MKVNVGIVGYGNLGKSVEKEILKNKEFKLVAIFSRRTVTSPFSTPVCTYDEYKNFKNKIDVMLLCGGSKSDIEEQAPEICKYFDTINTFDTHSKIALLKTNLNQIAKANNKRSIISVGWDPGLFSIIRSIFFAFSGKMPTTFWGKGMSLGHSDAIRRVNGVEDGVQFTVPCSEAITLAKRGKDLTSISLHSRDCYVVAEKNHKNIENQIKNIPNYFLGQPTNVTFVSRDTLNRLKRDFSHKGLIISRNFSAGKPEISMDFSVKMKSNPDFTAKIMCAYIHAVVNLKQENKTGSFTALDIPISYLFSPSNKDNLLSSLCWHSLFTFLAKRDIITLFT